MNIPSDIRPIDADNHYYEALDAFTRLARLEGIIPALESAHAVAECIKRAPTMRREALIIVNLSGRGDKDVAQAAAKIGLQMPK